MLINSMKKMYRIWLVKMTSITSHQSLHKLHWMMSELLFRQVDQYLVELNVGINLMEMLYGFKRINTLYTIKKEILLELGELLEI